MRAALAALLAIALGACAPESGPTASATPEYPGLTPLTGKVFEGGDRALVIFLHGDVSSGRPANYMHDYAQRVAEEHGVTAVALLRPGYPDGEGRRSPGSNHGRRDHYTAENNRLVTETIANLSAAAGDPRTIAVGHSGGAAQLGAVIGQSPGIVDVAILASCPCNVPQWRRTRRSEWPRSQSPSDFVGGVDPDTVVIGVTGDDDSNTRPGLGSYYTQQLSMRGIDASFVSVPGGGHGFRTIAPEVRRQIAKSLGET